MLMQKSALINAFWPPWNMMRSTQSGIDGEATWLCWPRDKSSYDCGIDPSNLPPSLPPSLIHLHTVRHELPSCPRGPTHHSPTIFTSTIIRYLHSFFPTVWARPCAVCPSSTTLLHSCHWWAIDPHSHSFSRMRLCEFRHRLVRFPNMPASKRISRPHSIVPFGFSM